MVDLNAHEAGNGGKKPREACNPTESPLLGDGPVFGSWVFQSYWTSYS